MVGCAMTNYTERMRHRKKNYIPEVEQIHMFVMLYRILHPIVNR